MKKRIAKSFLIRFFQGQIQYFPSRRAVGEEAGGTDPKAPLSIESAPDILHDFTSFWFTNLKF